MNEIPVTIRISGRSFFWEDILQSLESGRIRLQWRCTFYERNGEPIEYESEHDHNGRFFTGMEDYAEDDADFERIVNMLADENQNVARRVPAEKSAVEMLVTVEIKDDCDTGMCCICQERMTEGDLAKKMACGHLYHESLCTIEVMESSDEEEVEGSKSSYDSKFEWSLESSKEATHEKSPIPPNLEVHDYEKTF
ncbi:hypothetical protein SUGI_0728920 [Cryptomeria japonica]|nr:hypothetical protein SUGI_0728920 [Cryptomeria japonica]